MSKQKNENIGHINCGECNTVAALRQNAGKKLYYICQNCGLRPAPTTEKGQGQLLDRAQLWPMNNGQLTPPPSVPRWIAENWSWEKLKHNLSANEPHMINDGLILEADVPPGAPVVEFDGPEPPPEPAPEKPQDNHHHESAKAQATPKGEQARGGNEAAPDDEADEEGEQEEADEEESDVLIL